MEYIWVDGTKPVSKLRSKTKICHRNISIKQCRIPALRAIDKWNFDGSSTNQAQGGDSDRILQPVCVVPDPIRGEGNLLALCEVMNPDGSPHESNTRAKLRDTLDKGANILQSWWGFEQEYVLLKNGNILGWPNQGYPNPQGPYYCGVGSDEVIGRNVVEEHLQACIDANLLIFGII